MYLKIIFFLALISNLLLADDQSCLNSTEWISFKNQFKIEHPNFNIQFRNEEYS
jgi:hypothetical protein